MVLRLLGGFVLEIEGRICKPPLEKGRALLAYLAADLGRSHSRTALAAMFWPNLEADAALANLRQVLHNLRQVFASTNATDDVLHIDRESIRLAHTASVWVDAVEFATSAPLCPPQFDSTQCGHCRSQLEIVVSLYRGPFLADIALSDCPEFEAWLDVQREALRLRALARFGQIADCHEKIGGLTDAAQAAQRFLALDPWNEEGLRRVMRLLALAGQAATALSVFDAQQRLLARDLGMPLAPETHALAQSIRNGTLDRPSRAAPAPEAPPPAAAAERRQLTVLHCEITPLGYADPDSALTQLLAPQVYCREVIEGYGGHLLPLYGSSLLAYFGYPRADENASRHAVHAGLALIRSAFAGVGIRVGIHTGVVISKGNRQAPDALGSVSAQALRLAQLADTGEVAISDATQRLVAGYFSCESIGAMRTPEGRPGAHAYRIAADRGVRHRLEAAAELTPLVGRQAEVAALIALWQEARGGQRRAVLLSGDAGIGKSRLLLTLQGLLHEQHCRAHELRCFPERRHTPFFPLTTLLAALAGFLPDETAEEKFGKLAAFVEARIGNAARETVPALASLCDLPIGSPFRPSDASPQRQREVAQSFLLDLLLGLAQRQPLLLAVEDLHWCDPSTLAFLRLLVADRRPGPVLIVLSARPEFAPPWPADLVRSLPLPPLADDETAALIAAVAPHLSVAAIDTIVGRADGVPLFAEELAKDAATGERAIVPATIHDLLAARLDRVGDAKRVAQLAATIGREFPVDLLGAVSGLDDTALQETLMRLQHAGLIAGSRATRHFRHALIRDTAYDSQPLADRRAAHHAIGRALTASPLSQPELLAHHWTLAADYPQATSRWLEAGKLALHRSAVQEAQLHFRSGLTLVPELPSGAVRAHMELDMQLGLGAALSAAEGYASQDAASAYTRAMSLAAEYGGGPDLFPALWGVWASASSRAGYPHAAQLAEQLLQKALLEGDPVHIQQGHFALGDTQYWQGRFAEARTQIERVRTLYHPADHARHIFSFGEDAGATSGAYLSWILWVAGHTDGAVAASAAAIAQARRVGHPFTLAYALAFAALLHCRMNEPDTAHRLADETLDLANSHGLPLWQISATIARGWAQALQGEAQGAAVLQPCVAAIRDAMSGVSAFALAALADAQAALGHWPEALTTADEALAVGAANGDHHAEADLHRIRGLALHRCGKRKEAATAYRRALAIAQAQGALAYELRAATGLALLAETTSRRNEAQRELSAVLARFTEGFASADWRAAQACLETAPAD